MPEREVGAQPHHPATEEAWHDTVLADAVAYTKGLVALLDSLTEAFRQRGRELADGRQRLEILQGERRKVHEERVVLEERLRSLDGERDRVRADLERRSRELEQARAELKRAQETTETHGREVETLRASLAEASRQAARLEGVERELQVLLAERARLEAEVHAHASECELLRSMVRERDTELERRQAESTSIRSQLGAQAEELRALQAAGASARQQAEDLREIVRGLERERDHAARLHAARVAEADQERERAGEEARSAREALAQVGHQLETAWREGAAAQAQAEAFRVTVETERQTLTAERDAARRELEQRLPALAAAEEELAQTAQALAAQGDSLRERDARLEELRRLADELDWRVRSAEADRDTAHAKLARLSSEAAALTAARSDALRQLAEAREALGVSASRAKELEAALDRTRAEAVQVAEQARIREEERTRLRATIEGLEAILASIAAAMGHSRVTPADSGRETDLVSLWQPLADDARTHQDARTQAEAERDSLRATIRAAQEVVGPAASLPGRLRELVAERRDLAERVEALERQGDGLRAAVADATPRARTAADGWDPLARQVAPLAVTAKTESASAPSPAEPPTPAATVPDGRARAQTGQTPGARRASGLLDVRVILFLTGQGEETGDVAAAQVTGQVSALNHAGMVIALEHTVPVGQAVAVRLLRKGSTILVPGSVVRTQVPTSGSGISPTLDHLIRFEHPDPDSAAQLKAFLG